MTKNSSRTRRISKSYLLLILALVCGTVLITICFASFCISENKNIESNYFARSTYNGEAIKNAIYLTNKVRYAYESQYDAKLVFLLNDFQEQFSLVEEDPSQIDLEEIKQKDLALHPEGVNLYIIDDTNTIILSTEPSEIGYDFSNAPYVSKRLSQIRDGSQMVFDVTSRSQFSGEMCKFGYLPSHGHKYLLEIGISLPDISILEKPVYAGLDANIITTPNTVFLFGQDAVFQEDPQKGLVNLGTHENVLTEFPERLDYLSQAFSMQESFSVCLPEENKCVDYYFIPYPASDAPSYAYVSQVLEVTTDIATLHLNVLKNTLLFVIITIICDSVFISMVLLIIWYVVQPINLINDDIEIIANGDYDHKIRQTRGPEFDHLQANLTKMVSALKNELQENKEKTKQLNLELTQRKFTEKSLLNVTKQLNLLSGITRHDILNQITVAISALDLIADEREENDGRYYNAHESLFIQLRASVRNIEKQIQFTQLYDQMGQKEPMWQPVSPKIAEAEHDLCYPPGVICNHVFSLYVLANPMFDRVIYNLLDNAKRYATGMTSLEISFVEQNSGEGLLVFEDNGPGIEYENKSLLFDRGYGSSTGFGLYLIREILSITDIEIKETGVPGQGARFELRIPPGVWK